jgi:hypothetical protein
MCRHAFLTVTDHAFFPGTLATVNSVLEFHPGSEIFVVANHKQPLTPAQVECLRRSDRVKLLDSREFYLPGRYINAWELKAYACHDLCGDYDVMIGIDSDLLLCRNVDALIDRCHKSGGFLGGRDGDDVHYDASYAIYGIKTPADNACYMSTSLYFCAVNDRNRRILKRWTECCSAAEFNGTGPHPGYSDQGVLNAVIFAEGQTDSVELLDNRLWSQHWTYWDTIIDRQNGEFVNVSAGGLPQHAFHCGGTDKFWWREHRERVMSDNALQTYPYVWFLAMLWFGRCGNWSVDPCEYLPPEAHHLIEDLVNFFPQIVSVYSSAHARWNALSDPMIDRLICGAPRALSLGGGSMSELIGLVEANPQVRRFVEIGGYEGGSILSLALRFLNRDIDFYSVESFLGNLDGTVDGYPLPSRQRYVNNLAKFPTARAKLVPGDSGHVAPFFDDGSVDFVFIDGCHDTEAVRRDIDLWSRKLRPGGILAGDDYGWETVRTAVDARFPRVNVASSGCVWWLPL